MAFAFAGSSNKESVTRRVARMSSDTNARRLVSSHNLNIVNVSWEDCARSKMSCWGPCISDMTLQVGNTRMPVIREPNFTDKTWDVPIDKIPLRVGNERPEGRGSMRTISLSNYLRNFSDFLSKPPTGRNINLLVEDGPRKDRHVVMSSQACFLPIEEGDQTKFNVALYNYQSSRDSPAVLVIVSTSKGTSAQIVTGGDQKLLFNNHGRKADFAGQRLQDNRREREVQLDGEMSQEEKQDNVIVIIQVPLVHRERRTRVQESAVVFKKRTLTKGGTSPSRCRERSRVADVVPAVVRVAPRTEVTCTCGDVLMKQRASSCYGGRGICCDACDVSVRGKQLVYHCPRENSYSHSHGYDLCERCGNKQLEFDECGGRQIQRDVRFPIRVTLQFYKGTANGVMNADIMNEIASQLAASRTQAEAIGSLVTEITDRTTEPDLSRPSSLPVGIGEYREVERLLKRLKLEQYLTRFREQKVSDDALAVLQPHHLVALIDKIGHRAKFESELQRWKKNGGRSTRVVSESWPY